MLIIESAQVAINKGTEKENVVYINNGEISNMKRNEVRSPEENGCLLEVLICQLCQSQKKKPNTTYFFLFMGLILYRYIMYTQRKGELMGKDKT